MQGKIKWFSREKGYGYIVADNSQDEYYFKIQWLKGTNLPNNGDMVSFDPENGKRSPIAKNVQIIQQNSEKSSHDERETCQKCNKKMMPRIVVSHGEATHSVCPHCGKLHKRFTMHPLLKFLLGIFIIFVVFPILFYIWAIWAVAK